jgi:hypothetical protein
MNRYEGKLASGRIFVVYSDRKSRARRRLSDFVKRAISNPSLIGEGYPKIAVDDRLVGVKLAGRVVNGVVDFGAAQGKVLIDMAPARETRK